jgi:NADPH:quinone reductase-like Zn-dependent oxidoreductase
MPFILRGVTLCGIDSVNCPMPVREQVWQRLAGDLKPRHLQDMVRTLSFDQLQGAFPAYLEGGVKGRTVVKIS